jgi:hypothetical protein
MADLLRERSLNRFFKINPDMSLELKSSIKQKYVAFAVLFIVVYVFGVEVIPSRGYRDTLWTPLL